LVGFGACGEQSPYRHRVALTGGFQQSGPAAAVFCLDIGAVRDKKIDGRSVPEPGSPH